MVATKAKTKKKPNTYSSKDEDLGLAILSDLRKIIRAIDLDSKRLSSESNLTTPQVLTLLAVYSNGAMTLAALAAEVHLSPSTMVGIVDRLESKNLLLRERSTVDRRQVQINITEEGKRVAKKAPVPLQETLLKSLNSLSKAEQLNLVKTLNLLVIMLRAEKLEDSLEI